LKLPITLIVLFNFPNASPIHFFIYVCCLSQKDVAYDYFRRLDEARIVKLRHLIQDHERRLEHHGGKVDESMHRTLVAIKTRLSTLLSESEADTRERYAELHEAIQSDHILGLADLDFTRTGLK
jgi:hypothetical protein